MDGTFAQHKIPITSSLSNSHIPLISSPSSTLSFFANLPSLSNDYESASPTNPTSLGSSMSNEYVSTMAPFKLSSSTQQTSANSAVVVVSSSRSLSPAHSASSTSSSQSLALDPNYYEHSCRFLTNNQPLQQQPLLSYTSSNYTSSDHAQYHNCSYFPLNTTSSHNSNADCLVAADLNSNIYQDVAGFDSGFGFLPCSSSKHDASVGTDLSLNREVRLANQNNHHHHHHHQVYVNSHYVYNSNAVVTNGARTVNEKQSFKMIEPLPVKKHRTKYSKDQLELLEMAFGQNEYPDVSTVEHLCKSITISKDKINIWFQNRRARKKRTITPSIT